MLTIVPIVEGHGEVAALPELLRRLLYEVYHEYTVTIAKPKNARGCGNLTAENQIERFVAYAQMEPKCDAVLVLIDNDAVQGLIKREILDEDCAPAFAHYLATRIQTMHPTKPVAVVVARWEYEAWFLTSMETIGPALGLAEGVVYEGDVEAVRGAKGWIDQRMPPGRKYSETRDQIVATTSMDFAQAIERSRSFRRLQHAWEELYDAFLEGRATVTPSPDEEIEE